MNVEERLLKLERRLQEVEDQLEIMRLLNTYGPLVDSGESRAAARLWIEGGAYDVAVLASVEREGGLMEGIPVALVEAMAAGTVVVATDSGSIGELVDGTTGLLVPHSDPAALAAALARVAAEPSLCAELRDAARTRVARDYDVAATTAALRGLLARGVTDRPLGYDEPGTALEAALARDHG